MTTTKSKWSGVVAKFRSGLAKATRDGNPAWFLRPEDWRVCVVVRGARIHLIVEWYRPEAYSDDDLSVGGMLPSRSGYTRVRSECDAASLDEPAVTDYLDSLPSIYGRQLLTWYPPAKVSA